MDYRPNKRILTFIILISMVMMQFDGTPGSSLLATTPSSSFSYALQPSSLPTLTSSTPSEQDTTTTSSTISIRVRGVLVTNRSEPDVTTTLPDIVNRRQMTEEYIAFLRSEMDNPPTSTTLPVCGGTNVYCSVEYDSTGDGERDCCTQDNNPVCAGCLSYCVEECAKEFVGVSTCFVDARSGPICQCSKITPSCYVISDLPATTLAQVTQLEESHNSYVYFLVLSIIIVTLAAAIHFVYKAGK